MKKTLVVTSIVVVTSLIALMIFLRLTEKEQKMDYAEVRKGFFEISVHVMGELVAENSVDIKGPNIVRNRRFRSTPLKIVDLIPEGTQVSKGDFIAALDKSSFVNTLRDEQEELDTHETSLEMKILDTAVVLSALRDEIKNQFFVAEEAKITLAQSKYEPPATRRQADISVDKALRMLEQKRKLYSLSKAQVRAEIMTLRLKVSTQKRVVEDLDNILAAFTITAPSDGMVIYKRDRFGKKITAGTNLDPWNPVVATLPDLSSFLSKIYISEIDINKIRKDQNVEITIDAFPDKYFSGKITSIANIGEQLSNSDTKVFEVLVRIDEFNPMLRPSMTTGNKVVIETFNNVLFVPSESVNAGVDSIPFVYTKDGLKQIVVLGESNDKNIIIERGLEAGTRIWLNIPDKPEKFIIAGLELIPLIKAKEQEIARIEMERIGKYNDELIVLTVESGSSGSGNSAGSN